ncbi:MAG: hypothetical protein ABL951_06960 [Alphaproteobacteria bacterium]
MAWASEAAFTDQTAINNSTEEFLDAVSLNPRELCHVQLKLDNEHGSVVTDSLQVSVYATLDESSEVWDTHPLMQFTIKPNSVSAEYFSFAVMGVRKFRIGGLSTGATNTYTMGGTYRLDGVSA